MDIPNFNISSIKKEYFTERYGQFFNNIFHIPPPRRIPFSLDIEDYLDAIMSSMLMDISNWEVKKHIDRFITSCLILGDFLDNAYKVPLDIKRFKCETTFRISGTLLNPQLLEKLKELRGKSLCVTIKTATTNVVWISFSVDNSGLCRDSISTEFVCSNIPFPFSYISSFEIRPIPCTCGTYTIHNNAFRLPPYENIPLYINTPYVKEYAKYALEHPPTSPTYPTYPPIHSSYI